MDDKEKLVGDRKYPFKELLKKCYKYFKAVRWLIILALLVVFINVGLDIILPLFIEQVVDNLQDPVNIQLKIIISIAISYFGISLINQAFRFLETWLLQKAGNKVVYNLRVETFEHIQGMSLDQFGMMPTGSLVTRVCSYTSQLSDLFTSQIVNLIRNLVTVVGIYAIMLSISVKLSLIVLGFAIIVLIVSIFFRRRTSKLFRLEKGYISDLNTALSEDIQGMKIIQIFNQENKMKDEFYLKNKRMRDTRYSMMISFSIYKPFINFLLYLCIAVVFLFSANVGLSAGAVVAFYLYISKFFNPIEEISHQYVHIERALTSCERLFSLLDVPPKVVDKVDAKDVPHFKGKIEFKNVWFSYDNRNWVLKDVSFVVKKGETCAFVGATGAGKTTIFSLLTKAYVPQKGQILIDDVDINDIKISSLRKGIGQMLQDVFLFSGDIKANITLFEDKFTHEEINQACEYVNANHFIKKLDNGLEEDVVERGDNFSQGQKQLLSFARTILHKPEILLLDEATANIDTETEVLIQDSLNKMSTLGTMLVVAHRLSTIQHADKIICLQHGRIVESGTHEELLKNKNYYYKLYELQFK